MLARGISVHFNARFKRIVACHFKPRVAAIEKLRELLIKRFVHTVKRIGQKCASFVVNLFDGRFNRFNSLLKVSHFRVNAFDLSLLGLKLLKSRMVHGAQLRHRLGQALNLLTQTI